MLFKKPVLIAGFLLFSLSAFSQQVVNTRNEEEEASAKAASCIYGELGGNSPIFSANYDFRFRGQKGLGMRVGAGLFGGSGGGLVMVPIGLNNLSGKAPNYLEIGLGATYLSLTDDDEFLEGSTMLLVPSIGYRYQPLGKGFTARVFASPLISLNEGGGWFMWGGVSAGFKF